MAPRPGSAVLPSQNCASSRRVRRGHAASGVARCRGRTRNRPRSAWPRPPASPPPAQSKHLPQRGGKKLTRRRVAAPGCVRAKDRRHQCLRLVGLPCRLLPGLCVRRRRTTSSRNCSTIRNRLAPSTTRRTSRAQFQNRKRIPSKLPTAADTCHATWAESRMSTQSEKPDIGDARRSRRRT